MGNKQICFMLSVDLVSLEKKKKKNEKAAAGFQSFGRLGAEIAAWHCRQMVKMMATRTVFLQ